MNTKEALDAAQQNHAVKAEAERIARAGLDTATAELENSPSDKARKAYAAAETAANMAGIELRGATRRLEQARAEHEEAERAASAEQGRIRFDERRRATSVESFRAQLGGMLQELAAARARAAELEAQASKLADAFQSEQEALFSTALELGAQPSRVNFRQALAIETALASGQPASEILGKRTLPDRMTAATAIECARRGLLDEAIRLINQLDGIVQRQQHCARAFAEGDTDRASTLRSLASQYADTCSALETLGLDHLRISPDHTATRIVVAGAEEVGRLVVLLRGISNVEVEGANDQERAAGRLKLEARTRQQLRDRGLDDVAEIARPARLSQRTPTEIAAAL